MHGAIASPVTHFQQTLSFHFKYRAKQSIPVSPVIKLWIPEEKCLEAESQYLSATSSFSLAFCTCQTAETFALSWASTALRANPAVTSVTTIKSLWSPSKSIYLLKPPPFPRHGRQILSLGCGSCLKSFFSSLWAPEGMCSRQQRCFCTLSWTCHSAWMPKTPTRHSCPFCLRLRSSDSQVLGLTFILASYLTLTASLFASLAVFPI